MTDIFPHAGKSFEVKYGDLAAINAYGSEGTTLYY